MRMALVFCLLAGPALADIVVPTRTIRPGEVIAGTDLTLKPGTRDDVAGRIDDVIGQEARVALYAGRPIRLDDLGPPALIDRNQLVTLVFLRGGLAISAEGRALARGAEGDRIRVMNLSSRATVTGRVNADGTVVVQ